MRRLVTFVLTCMVASVPSAIGARGRDDVSWGKAGVLLPQFVTDSNECAETSRYVVAYIRPETLRRLDALSSAQLLDTVVQIGASAPMQTVEAIAKLRSADDIARRSNTFGAKYVSMVSLDVRDQLQAVVDRCLVERGYVQVRLTPSQMASLSHYKRHSAGRAAFLHSLDSDPAVIDAQRVATG